MSRPDALRSTPWIDRSHVGTHWTDEWRLRVVDGFSSQGGVGHALGNGPAPLDPHEYAGFDIKDYSGSYPGRFAQVNLLDTSTVELGNSLGLSTSRSYATRYYEVDDRFGLPTRSGLKADLVWISFPCTAYSPLTACNYPDAEDPQQAALDDNPRITDELRELALDIAPHYVIENVPGATRVGDLHANVRVNGLAFAGADEPDDQKFNLERHFETTFPCPDAFRDPNPDEEYITIDTRDDQSITELAEAKGVPPSWGRQNVRSAIPWTYVYWLLHHCPSVPGPAPKRVTRMLAPQMNNSLGLKATHHPHS